MARKRLTKKESEAYLHQAFYGHLSTTEHNKPYTIPVNFVYQQDHIYIRSACRGRKLSNIRQNPHVCFEISQPIALLPGEKPCQYGVYYWSVLVFGRAKILDDLHLKTQVLKLFIQKYCKNHHSTIMTTDDILNVTIIDIESDTITGKAHLDKER